jgi:LuxR family transcriptional regulator, maltose regulon positive regulatory protein
LRALADGRSNQEIAAALFVTGSTVKTHLAHIYTKLGVRTRHEAVARAVELGLLS